MCIFYAGFLTGMTLHIRDFGKDHECSHIIFSSLLQNILIKSQIVELGMENQHLDTFIIKTINKIFNTY